MKHWRYLTTTGVAEGITHMEIKKEQDGTSREFGPPKVHTLINGRPVNPEDAPFAQIEPEAEMVDNEPPKHTIVLN